MTVNQSQVLRDERPRTVFDATPGDGLDRRLAPRGIVLAEVSDDYGILVEGVRYESPPRRQMRWPNDVRSTVGTFGRARLTAPWCRSLTWRNR